MSYVKSNLEYIPNCHRFTREEAEALSVEAFDRLNLTDQIYLYNNHRSVYDRLSGNETDQSADTATADTDKRSKASVKKEEAMDFATEFEKVVDASLKRIFHPNEQ